MNSALLKILAFPSNFYRESIKSVIIIDVTTFDLDYLKVRTFY